MKTKDLINMKIEDLTFSVVDVETTGMHAEFNRVMDIGIVKVKNGQIISEWETLIDPDQEIPYYISEFTNISQGHVKNKPRFEEFAPKVSRKLQNSIFVAHNVYFDYWFIYFEMKRAGIKFDVPKLCTVMLGKKLTLDLESANLDSLASRYNIQIENRHRALPDARAAAELLILFIRKAKEKYKIRSYYDLYNLQWMRIGKKNYHRGLFDENL